MSFRRAALASISSAPPPPSSFRYFKWIFTPNGNTGVRIWGNPNSTNGSYTIDTRRFGLLTSEGVRLPASRMTSNSAPSPLVVSDSNGGNAFNAFKDGAGSSALVTSKTEDQWLKIDLGSGNDATVVGFRALKQSNDGEVWNRCKLYGSATGAFAGEETLIKDTGVRNTDWNWSSSIRETFTLGFTWTVKDFT